MVRLATEADLGRINELRQQVNRLHVEGRPDIFRPGFSNELRDYARTLIASPEHDILVCEREGAICGIACVDYVVKPESPYSRATRFYHVEELCVDAARRRQGVARELTDFMRADARRRGLDRIVLDVWEFNDEALAFYDAMGFRTFRRMLELRADEGGHTPPADGAQ